MSHEAPKINTPEQTQTAQEHVGTAFKAAQERVYDVLNDPRFHVALQLQHKDKHDDSDPAYWTTMREHVQGLVGPTPDQSHPMVADALRLITATPSFVDASHRLVPGNSKTHIERQEARKTTNRFNGMIMEFARKHPQAKVSEVTAGLLNMASFAGYDGQKLAFAEQRIKSSVRLAQHKLGYGQILSRSDREWRVATPAEQAYGTSYVVGGHTGPLTVEVTPTSAKIERKGVHDKSYEAAHNHVVTHSLVQDSEFRDQFFVPDQLAAERAPYLDDLLTRAEYEQSESVLTYSS